MAQSNHNLANRIKMAFPAERPGRWSVWLLGTGVLLLSGCVSMPWNLSRPSAAGASTLTTTFSLLPSDQFKNATAEGFEAELKKGMELFTTAKADAEYVEARTIFHRLAVSKHTPSGIA